MGAPCSGSDRFLLTLLDGVADLMTNQENHPLGCPVEMYAPCSIRPWDAKIINPCMQPHHGDHSHEILTALGYSEAQIDKMMADRVAAREWSVDYVPGGDPWKEQDVARFGALAPHAADSKL